MDVYKFVTEYSYKYTDFFYSIGYFGEFISFVITCALIYNHSIYLICYIIVFLLNTLINKYLKQFFHQYRPNKPVKFLDSDQFSKKKYGMPSGHSQNTFFSIIYTYLVTRRFIPWTLLLFIIGCIVVYERYKYRNHTINQLIAGIVVGIFMAYLTYNIATFIMKHV